MRALERVLNAVAFLGAAFGLSASALAQTDPNAVVQWNFASVTKPDGTTVTLNQVTLSRTKLQTYAAYYLTYANHTTNALNRLYFTSTVTNNGTDNGAYNQIYYTPPNGGQFDCSGYGTATLSCTSGGVNSPATGITLNPGQSMLVTIVVAAPTTGTTMTASVSAGGFEGNSLTGQGCCASTPAPLATTLIDSTNSTTFSYTTEAITFVKGSGGRVFTGNQAITSNTDPYTTDIGAANFTTTTANYTIGTIQEQSTLTTSTNCANGGRFSNCFQSAISMPNVGYGLLTPQNACTKNPDGSYQVSGLTEVLRIDSSLIKGSPTQLNLSTIQVYYTPDATSSNPAPSAQGVLDCSVASTLPCICSRYQYTPSGTGGLLTYTKDLKNDIELVIRNYKNGTLEFF